MLRKITQKFDIIDKNGRFLELFSLHMNAVNYTLRLVEKSNLTAKRAKCKQSTQSPGLNCTPLRTLHNPDNYRDFAASAVKFNLVYS